MKQYIVDAFTDKVFGGNQAAVCVMDSWISDSLMQNIAKENNFSETAFTVKEGKKYHLRWFTPAAEIDFCRHATLGTAFVLFNFYEKAATKITFKTQVGELTVEKQGELFKMNFPYYRCNKIEVTDKMEEALGVRPKEAYIDRDLLLVLENAEQVRNLKPQPEQAQRTGRLVHSRNRSERQARIRQREPSFLPGAWLNGSPGDRKQPLHDSSLLVRPAW